MLLYIVKFSKFKYGGSHVLIGNPFIGKNCRCQIAVQIHMGKPFIILFCNLVIACPEFFCFFIGKAFHPFHDFFCLLHKYWKFLIRFFHIDLHFLCRRKNNPHGASFYSSASSICWRLSAAFTLPKAFTMIPSSSIR